MGDDLIAADYRTPGRTTGLDATEEWLERWTAQISAQAARAAELTGRLAALYGRARSADGDITVTVSGDGRLATLELDHDPDLARRISEVLRRAQSDLTGQVADHVRATVGTDSATGQAVLDAYEMRFPCPPA